MLKAFAMSVGRSLIKGDAFSDRLLFIISPAKFPAVWLAMSETETGNGWINILKKAIGVLVSHVLVSHKE